ncbi:hypothetical protein A1O7_05701 [Cladophialophora yegresii CBS 114405]|uniref:Uncharacterized protein n=1 Tax=Cladophialophora yegresii CBS 114405 TaxID=1182544 RepID=W9W176_9EURO|nr:uncharacterized protein A1O7_05701 [Cladophialophora yegresii CBS 114405]EXJ58276.1 hypothetical protein A1O7_05701 [Cladophialophora yegresii CBS 114405]
MAKDKDDPDLSPTPAALGGSGSHQKTSPSPDTHAPETASAEKPVLPKSNVDKPVAVPGSDNHPGPQDKPSPSSSDANTPNTLSSEEHPKTQPYSDFETSSEPEESLIPSTKRKKQTPWTMIPEPDPGELHPDLDLTDPNTVTRLLALLLNGWVLSRGRGPRNHDTCLWCRGAIDSDVDILTHVGTDSGSKCRNSWPATCLMDWTRQELDTANSHRLKCPMCSTEFCNSGTKSAHDFKVNQGKADAESVLDAAWLRVVLFSPLFAREAALKEGKHLIFVKGAEAKKLILLGQNKVIFYQCEGLLDPVESENKRRWLKRQYGDNLPWNVEKLTEMGIAQSEATAIMHAYTQSAASPAHDSLELQPRFDTTWVIIDRGNNQFIMSPFLTQQAHNVIRLPVQLGSGVINDMTAAEFNDHAKKNGGLLAAIKGFDATKDEDFKRHRMLAEGWIQHLLAKNKRDGIAGPKYEFWKRVKDAHDVNLDFSLAAGEKGEGDNDDEWEDDDEVADDDDNE